MHDAVPRRLKMGNSYCSCGCGCAGRLSTLCHWGSVLLRLRNIETAPVTATQDTEGTMHLEKLCGLAILTLQMHTTIGEDRLISYIYTDGNKPV